MKNITIARIDDRLIHGQVVTSWVKSYPINEILIIADDLGKNMLMQRIYKSVAPSGISVKIMTNIDALNYLREESRNELNLLILVKTPDVFEYLVDNGIHLEKIILGGMGLLPGREVLIRNVSANEAERESLMRLMEAGIKIVYQMLPSNKERDIEKILTGS